MEIPDRRTALLGLTSAGMSTLLTLSQSSQTSAIDVGEKKELFVVGPYNLGHWFAKTKIDINGLFNFGAPTKDDIIKSFKECSVYVIDQRIRPVIGTVRFAKNDYPRVTVAGPYYHEWKDKKNTFTIQIALVLPDNVNTDSRKPPPTRQLNVSIKLMYTGETALARTSGIENFMFGPLTYDLEGRMR